MIKLKRPRKAPTCLVGPNSAAAIELAAATLYYTGAPTKAYPFRVYKRPEVKIALEVMSRNKCAYCETDYGAAYDGAVEHYRPKGRMPNDPHPGYWWLAASWTNLLPSCQHCNEGRGQVIVTPTMTMGEATRLQQEARRTPTFGKASQFPVRHARRRPFSRALSAEDPLIIDPTRRDPTEHISFPPETGVSLATPRTTANGPDPHGLTTINVTALNRYHLVRARSRLLMDLRSHVLALARALETADLASQSGDTLEEKRAQDNAIAAMNAIKIYSNPSRPYSAVALWLFWRLESWLTSERASGVKMPVPALVII